MLSIGDKNKIIALTELGLSGHDIAKKLNVKQRTVAIFLGKLKTCSPGKFPERFSGGSGRLRKMTPSKIDTIKRSIHKNPMLSSTSLKKIHPRKLFTVSPRSIWCSLIRDLGLRSFVPAKKPLLTQKIIESRLNFCRKYESWSEKKWMSVLPTVKKPGSVMIWGCFSGNGGRGGLYFLPLNQTMNSKTYLEVLNDHLLLFFRTHRCQFFFKMCALSHCSSG